MTAVEAQRELPRYRSHKSVHALKLKRIEPNGSTLVLHPADDQYATIPVPVGSALHANVQRARQDHPDDPGYFVVYTDGYKSWSPTPAFEEGYTLEA